MTYATHDTRQVKNREEGFIALITYMCAPTITQKNRYIHQYYFPQWSI